MNNRQSASVSPWTFATQVTHTATQWSLQWTWPPVTFERAETIAGWLLSLKGQVGTFRYAPRQHHAFTMSGTTLARPGYSYSDMISAKGWAANTATGLRVGQYFSIGNQLLRIIEAGAFADANGAVTISFAPELRATFSAGAPVNFTSPSGVFRLASSETPGYTLTPDRLPEFGTIQASEAV